MKLLDFSFGDRGNDDFCPFLLSRLQYCESRGVSYFCKDFFAGDMLVWHKTTKSKSARAEKTTLADLLYLFA